MSLRDRKHYNDPSPDWVEDLIGIRISKCITHLHLYGILTESETRAAFKRFDEYIDECQKREVKE